MFRRGIEVNPGAARLRYNAGMAALASGDTAAAIARFQESAMLDSTAVARGRERRGPPGCDGRRRRVGRGTYGPPAGSAGAKGVAGPAAALPAKEGRDERTGTPAVSHRPRGDLDPARVVVARCSTASLENGFVSWDDQYYVTNNPHIRVDGWDDVLWFFTHSYYWSYIPLTMMSEILPEIENRCEEIRKGGVPPA